jgi:hypothetical protein
MLICACPPRETPDGIVRNTVNGFYLEEGRSSFAERTTATIGPCILLLPGTLERATLADRPRCHSAASVPATSHHQLQESATEIDRLLQHHISTIRAVKLDLFLDDG